jgi:osmotically-inducible protein OsmY
MSQSPAPAADLPLEIEVGTALAESPYLGRPNLRIEASEGRVTLHGRVASYFQKQMAQESVRRVTGVVQIQNLLEVAQPPQLT